MCHAWHIFAPSTKVDRKQAEHQHHFWRIEMNTILTIAARALMICVAATLGFSAVDASAGNLPNNRPMPGSPPTYLVKFADLDLARIEGVTTLYRRLSHAAREV